MKINSKKITIMDSKTEPASEAKERIEREANKYADEDKFVLGWVPANKGYIAGATAEYNRAQEEITRLKAELERERELVSTREAQQDVMAVDTVRLLDQIEYQNKQAKVDYDKIKKLEFELERERELRKELTAMLNTCHKSLRTYGEHPLIDSWVNNLIEKAKN